MTEKRHIDPERAATRRRQVLDAATICFRRSGFHGASMSEISKAAGMSAGHIYNYFASKDAIIAAFVEDNVTRVMELIHAIEIQPDPLQAIVDDVEQSVRNNLDPDHWALPLEIFAESARNPVIAALSQDADRRMGVRFHALLKAGREKHGLAADDAIVAARMEAVICLYQGLQLRALHNPGLPVAGVVDSFRIALKALLFS
ncbi:TetR/AcrR family transcriptional regulator [Pseudoduganella sp. OTU4001]|uniref:TetR/AcrR family transcriptional regulator n=1 Tax=Pseudoduganella sp. OTU4001 TaxID=3043854 RepID=UPI00313D7289